MRLQLLPSERAPPLTFFPARTIKYAPQRSRLGQSTIFDTSPDDDNVKNEDNNSSPDVVQHQPNSPAAVRALKVKRRRVSHGCNEEDMPEDKRLREELQSHPLYEEHAPKVILVCNDGQKFNVDERTLAVYR